ncbi:energy-coupling factor ABC transporter substrate-binding protein [Chrysosporum bergii ANA360D]|uniref:Cobalt transport protein CbiN n=1 Tax=Chrysosporum bergii ANA360D TaxID=617107 RepID=A0AA43GT71_9CYAN|nr:energy-coupling factor ABC transporter substrate-binding protein [Chrysosporum bergii]MDH6060527.1 energy-coupling factor ABC transporter substrate-binding protein [Chrysosporum bergii ANA360D]
MSQFKGKSSNWLLILAVLSLAIAPVIFIRDAEFNGADGQAEEAIGEVRPEYEPWFKPVFEPPSGEVESLLFSFQAALGAGVIGYVMGLYRERFRQQRNK